MCPPVMLSPKSFLDSVFWTLTGSPFLELMTLNLLLWCEWPFLQCHAALQVYLSCMGRDLMWEFQT